MVSKTTLEEDVRSPIDGTETVRLATTGANWKATLNSIFGALSAAAAGSDSEIQYNSSGAFAGDADFTWVPSAGLRNKQIAIFGNHGSLSAGDVHAVYAPGDPVHENTQVFFSGLLINNFVNVVDEMPDGFTVWPNYKTTSGTAGGCTGGDVEMTISSDSTGTWVQVFGFNVAPVNFGSGNITGEFAGLRILQNHFGSGLANYMPGLDCVTATGGSATATTWLGAEIYLIHNSTGAVDSAYGVRISMDKGGGAGTVTNAYGIDLWDFSSIATTSYNLYSRGTGSRNVFEGRVDLRFGKLTALTVATLPGSPAAGMYAYVTDSNTATWGATVAAGGANKVMVWYNGTNWTVVGA